MSTGGVTSRSFSYDAAGNLTQDQDVFYSQTQVLAWNHPGQIASVTRNSIPRGAYTYDYLHRLVARDIQSGVGMVHRVHDLDGNVIAEHHASGYLMTEYVWLEDRPIAVIADAGSTPRTLWVHTDHLERPFLMTNAAGNVVWEASYKPFGEVASITGSETLDHRFPGQWFQMESGLHYNWHRHYDATTGRYVSPDPIGMPDGPSRYAYVLNSPLMHADRKGMKALIGPMTPKPPDNPDLKLCLNPGGGGGPGSGRRDNYQGCRKIPNLSVGTLCLYICASGRIITQKFAGPVCPEVIFPFEGQ
jgi:RHS repeat-associated protein